MIENVKIAQSLESVVTADFDRNRFKFDRNRF